MKSSKWHQRKSKFSEYSWLKLIWTNFKVTSDQFNVIFVYDNLERLARLCITWAKTKSIFEQYCVFEFCSCTFGLWNFLLHARELIWIDLRSLEIAAHVITLPPPKLSTSWIHEKKKGSCLKPYTRSLSSGSRNQDTSLNNILREFWKDDLSMFCPNLFFQYVTAWTFALYMACWVNAKLV